MHDIFYFTDVHGQLDLFQTMRDWCYKQDPECTIVFGGDACDRGEFGFDIMEMILDDPQMIYIRGNHEDLFIKSARELMDHDPSIKNRKLSIQEADDVIDYSSWMHYTRNHLYNGGRSTLKAWLLSGTGEDFVNRLDDNTVLTLDSGRVCFTHAGGTYEAFKRVNQAEYDGDAITSDDYYMVIWDRDYLGAWWPQNKTIVFGHTPTCFMSEHYPDGVYMSEDNMRPLAYRPTSNSEGMGLHIDMDTGMTWTGIGYVLNCNTMHVYGFEDPDVNKMNSKRPVKEFENFKII